VVDAINQQAGRLLFSQMNIVISPLAIELSEKLNEITPPTINNFFLSNSGAEAVEGAVKLARSATGKRNIIVFQGSFHGRTHQAMAMTTSKTIYRQNYQPLPGAIFVAPFPYSYFYGWDEEQTIAFCLKQLDLILHSQSAPSETAAFVIEPILGEGGYVPAPPPFMQALHEIAAQHDILLIVDEVQTGFCRTGKWAAYEHYGVTPDLSTWAKSMGGGLPIAAVVGKAEVMDSAQPGTIGGTYGGNPVACAAALATIKLMEELKLNERAETIGQRARARFQELQKKCPAIGDVRGLGAMIGMEFVENGDPHKPATKLVADIQKACLLRGLLLIAAGTYSNVIRVLSPLVITDEQLERGLNILAEEITRHARTVSGATA
jgi:4-aminobutyrate aminotransferase